MDFIWQGNKLKTLGELMDAAVKCSTDEATEFLRCYESVTPNARENLGYLSGYLSENECKDFRQKFGVVHPIFGEKNLSSGDIFKFGMRVGELLKTKTSQEAIKIAKEEFGLSSEKPAENKWHLGALEG